MAIIENGQSCGIPQARFCGLPTPPTRPLYMTSFSRNTR